MLISILKDKEACYLTLCFMELFDQELLPACQSMPVVPMEVT